MLPTLSLETLQNLGATEEEISAYVKARLHVEQAHINALRDEQIPSPSWSTEALARDFDVEGFRAPYVVVRRKRDGMRGSLMFRHFPRVYFGWVDA